MEFCNRNSYSYNTLRTETIEPPSYLKELFVDEDNIILVYDKVKNFKSLCPTVVYKP